MSWLARGRAARSRVAIVRVSVWPRLRSWARATLVQSSGGGADDWAEDHPCEVFWHDGLIAIEAPQIIGAVL